MEAAVVSEWRLIVATAIKLRNSLVVLVVLNDGNNYRGSDIGEDRKNFTLHGSGMVKFIIKTVDIEKTDAAKGLREELIKRPRDRYCRICKI